MERGGGGGGGGIDYRSRESRSVTHTPAATALMDASGEQGALFSAACHSQTSRVTQDGGPPSLGSTGGCHGVAELWPRA